MTIIDRLLQQIGPNTKHAVPVDLCIGSHWTVVALEMEAEVRGGLSSTLGGGSDDHHHGGRFPVKDAGRLLTYSAMELASLAHSDSLTEASVGIATINALLTVDESQCVDVNAADVIAERGTGKKVAVIGHFPFIPMLRKIAKPLWVLELDPREGDLPASSASEILPQADVLALTGTSLLNHTFERLMQLCNPQAFVIVLGGTTPLSNVLFDYGVDAIAGTQLVDPQAAKRAISQGATFRQIPGRHLLTMFKHR